MKAEIMLNSKNRRPTDSLWGILALNRLKSWGRAARLRAAPGHRSDRTIRVSDAPRLHADHQDPGGNSSASRASKTALAAARRIAKSAGTRTRSMRAVGNAPEARRAQAQPAQERSSERPTVAFDFGHLSADNRGPEGPYLTRAGRGLLAAVRSVAKLAEARPAQADPVPTLSSERPTGAFDFGHLGADHREGRGPSLTRAGAALVALARSWATPGQPRKTSEARRADRTRGMFEFSRLRADYREPDWPPLTRAGEGLVATARGMVKTDKSRRAQ
ncbi:MAG: hypothetical protein KGJ66_04225 [Alphaproteobacteria bacterium]|nr:hypothetical protein [Alphaproteobacteria bacterium]